MLQEISSKNNIFQQKILTSVEISNMLNGNATIFVRHWESLQNLKTLSGLLVVITKPNKYFGIKELLIML